MKRLTSDELREMYLQYFESQGHARIPSAPLVPENDPSVLFTTAGMHPLVPYLKGQPHPAGTRLTDVQKSLRTTDIDEVGDATHATVFEMLGNWSLGDYFKSEAIQMSWEFLVSDNWLNLDPDRLAVSVFAGDDDAPRDEESATEWKQVGVDPARIAYLDKAENWWPAGGGAPGPQGPDTEMFYWVGFDAAPASFDPDDDQWVEIWNDVFMQFNRTDDGSYEELPQKNVDTGMGLERVVMVLNGLSSIYDIDTYEALRRHIQTHERSSDVRHHRIVADHIKASMFVMGDEHPITPSKSEQGYVLRRLIRRALRSCRQLGIDNPEQTMVEGIDIVANTYQHIYPSLDTHRADAKAAMSNEVKQFEAVMEQGLKQFELLVAENDQGVVSGADAFRLYETYGFPYELTSEVASEKGLRVDEEGFTQALKAHQETSRSASAGKFAGGLADHSTESVQYHTATHLLHQALRTVLGDHVLQKGSNITPERLRFDFSHPEKLSDEERSAVEDLVNRQIAAALEVTREEMSVAEAKKAGALGLFEDKYADQVNVYRIDDFSIEICGGPHVSNTSELGTFRITKEESASAGVRRIKAVLE